MKGSPKYLAKQMMRTVCARNITNLSRHEMKAQVRSELEAKGEVTTQANVAKHMPVYSTRTEAAYKKAWESFFEHVRREYGVRDPAQIKRRHVEEFLQYKINQDVKLRTFKSYAAAISKLEVALNNVRKYPIRYSETVDRMRELAKGDLDGTSELRAYKNPEAVIAELKIPEYKLAAELQLYSGGRIAEVSELKNGRNLLGYTLLDKDTERERYGWGIRYTNSKGGRVRTMEVSEEFYKRVEKAVAEKGVFEIDRHNYSASLRRAANRAGEQWHGSHGLRWNYAQNSFRAHRENGGKSYHEALQEVSLELGHSRPGITLHYLRGR